MLTVGLLDWLLTVLFLRNLDIAVPEDVFVLVTGAAELELLPPLDILLNLESTGSTPPSAGVGLGTGVGAGVGLTTCPPSFPSLSLRALGSITLRRDSDKTLLNCFFACL